jgi:Flp pilus assembly CpaE family ATPase
LSPNIDTRYPDSIGAEVLSIALIGPDEERRRTVASALAECRGAKVREFTAYPTALDDVPRLLEQYFDVIIIDLDSDTEFALELVESICAKDAVTVMVYSTVADQDLVVRCMRAGAREYLIPPFDQSSVAEALVRASAIVRPRTRPVKKAPGKLLVFLGAKGGSGVTTIACNFAIALAQDSPQNTLLIDLALPMGDAALNLGIAAEYSTDHALQDADRLDASFLLKLVSRHQSGVALLAAPSKVPEVEASREAIDKLVSVARSEFDNVVVDLGSRIDLMGTALFKEAYTIYLVTQAGISELRNSNRLIQRFFNDGGPKLEIVINRFEPRFLGVTEELVAKALSKPVRWKIPDDYDATRQMQDPATGLTGGDSTISRLILEMASSVTGVPVPQEKKKGFSLKGFGKTITEKIATSEKPPTILAAKPAAPGAAPSVEWSNPEPITYGTPLGDAQLNATASVPGSFVYTPRAGYVLPAGTHSLWVTFNPADASGDAALQAAASIAVSKAAPAIRWSAPSTMICGAALGAAQLNASASVPGTFAYSPAEGELLKAGAHTLSVTFNPTDQANYSAAQASVSVNIAKATPSIAWQAPEPIPCGTALGAAQLNARASIPGTFTYSPAEGELLDAGTHSLAVTFTPADHAAYATAQATVSLLVNKATPDIAWPSPEPIPYGSMLGESQLNATASVAGAFAYNPGPGSVLAAGEHTPTVTFIPSDPRGYITAQAATTLTVTRAIPVLTWHTPEPIIQGAALGAVQLNAAASVPGSFTYSPAAGELLSPGEHRLSVTFTPVDSMNYTTAQTAVSLHVSPITPSLLTWPAPTPLSYGTPLSSSELNALASVSGTFVYGPSEGDVLPPGRHMLSVSFTPHDPERYSPAQASVLLVVEAVPEIASLLAAKTSAAQSNPAPAGRSKAAPSGNPAAAPIPRETRTYKGAIYEKGDDGQWHLQQN